MARKRIGIVLAAGKGTRIKSTLPKVLHPVLGKPMLQRVLESLAPLGLDEVVVIVGHQAEQVESAIQQLNWPFPVRFVLQAPQLGTGHALMQVLPLLPADQEAEVLITCGDMPLVPSARYRDLLDDYTARNAQAVVVSVSVSNPTGYGRVISSEDNRFLRIVEEKDASDAEKRIAWINAGIYAAHWPSLAAQFDKLDQNNAQEEFYLTDCFALLAESAPQGVLTHLWPDEDDVLGINSREQLSQAGDILSHRTALRLMQDGVSLVNPDTMTLAPEIEIGPDTVLYPGCMLVGDVKIGAHCQIGPHTTMRGNIRIGDRTQVIQSFLDRAVTVGEDSFIGPFAHLRDNAAIGNTVKIGNFVEVKETRFGDRSNAAHLCYLGDVDVGTDVNMGAGSIVANYDPIRDIKHRSVIADGVKVGCNSVLVAPVTVGDRACVAAGSIITKDVAPWDLAIARARQSTISQWVQKTLQNSTSVHSTTT